MLKKTIKSIDFDGNERVEDYYFNITKTELSKMQLSVSGGMTAKLQTIVDAQDAPAIMKVFEEFIDMAYGIKSADGKHFVKNKEALEEFKSTAAYDNLYMELLTDNKAAMAFITGILPADIAQGIADEMANDKLNNIQ